MTALTPRLQPMFEKIKPVCFGRFMVDVPASATVAWGGTDVPLGVTIYRDGVGEIKALAQKFIEELNSEKALNHDDVPLLLSVEKMADPEGKIVTGYESFQSINGLKINGYFKLNSDGVIIDARPLRDGWDETIADIKSIARRLRQRPENDIPTEPGNCLEHTFLPDKQKPTQDDLMEHIRIGFRLKEFPDAHFSIYVAPSNPHNPEGDSLKTQWKRIKENPTTPEEKAALAKINYFRESSRQIHDWKTGYEVLVRNPDEERVHSYHDFQAKFTGVPHDPFRPYADIQFQTGVGNNAAGSIKASLTDEEAIAVWDRITSTIRVRPTSLKPVESTDTGPRLPLGELAATGRTCPQTGWWEHDAPGPTGDSRRRHFRAGERMPHTVAIGEPSIWQKLQGERPSYRTATVWKLVSYDDAPPVADVIAQPTSIAQSAPPDALSNDATNTRHEAGHGEGTAPVKKR
ncbi:T6SS immunity protein Tli4 family protein [Massilia sp. H6]|uniref:T6SS immunity protein Tli4 family protein n=1 Tax=Massilia sp. H6 TaxID=2970464 RepID=UPI002168B8DC|nr:T6SS immunity protein Tli4 family protein [Massilia sp. H6]UVW28616.1 T6SS immunity protein Tli4 family protein [Massilia sp. H6]